MQLSNWYYVVNGNSSPFPWALRQFQHESTESVVVTRQSTREAMSDYVSNHARYMFGGYHSRLSTDLIGDLLVVTDIDSQQTIVIDVTNL